VAAVFVRVRYDFHRDGRRVPLLPVGWLDGLGSIGQSGIAPMWFMFATMPAIAGSANNNFALLYYIFFNSITYYIKNSR
jgi:hypothetical protein